MESPLKFASQDKTFISIIEKITKNENLNNRENSIILTYALILFNFYKKDMRKIKSMEFAYYLILKYSLKEGDYRPLFDAATNLGYFPISWAIQNLNLIENNNNIVNEVIADGISKFTTSGGIVKTLQQWNRSNSLINSDSNELMYVAPTSYGKSSLIVDYVRSNLAETSKMAIITPTKSLLTQTYQMLRDANLDRKIILHDEMYNGEETFLGVLTQERALRLIAKNNIILDVLIIDEAHNILKFDSRSVLISRLIKKCRKSNNKLKIIYLSPLIENNNSIATDYNQNIEDFRIVHSIKEMDIGIYSKNGEVKKYNRFIDRSFLVDLLPSYSTYIKQNSLEKNFIFINTPKKIEDLALNLTSTLTPAYQLSEEIIELKKILSDAVHPQYKLIELLDYGVVYIHGKTPDMIKEYLEYKFKTVSGIKYLIANTVILEGINLPIDSLFIVNSYGLSDKDIVNLIGRVNRLDSIFNGHESSLRKLISPVHFVYIPGFTNKSTNMENKAKILKKTTFVDKVKNPVLVNYKGGKKKSDKLKVEYVLRQESICDSEPVTEFEFFRKKLVEGGISTFYKNFERAAEIIYKNVSIFSVSEYWNEKSIMGKIHIIFLLSLEDFISDEEFKRLKNIAALEYYNNFITFKKKRSLSENIVDDVQYFLAKKISDNPYFYIGPSFGEIPYSQDGVSVKGRNSYIDLSKKSYGQLVNIAVIKNKIESDFVGYKLNQFITFMKDQKIISEDEYNLSIYGHNNSKVISLTRYGLSLNLISRLQGDQQLENINFSESRIVGNNDFSRFAKSINDLYRFELSKFITW